MKTAFLFSGQGAQYQGMGQELYKTYPIAHEVFDEASEVLGYDMARLCFDDNEQLDQTEYTQPAILTVSTAMLKIAEKEGLKADIVAGLSLGEYTALVASGAIPFNQAVRLVATRGRLMAEAAPKGSGKMVAVMNASVDLIERCCLEATNETKQVVAPANYNTPQQIVIGGDVIAVDLAVSKLTAEGVRRCIELNVSGPFHTPLLQSAAEKLAMELSHYTFSPMQIPLVANTTAAIMKNQEVKTLLERQVMSPVRFYESIATIQKQGVTEFIEIGPGKVLSGFLKKIDKQLQINRIENQETLTATLTHFN